MEHSHPYLPLAGGTMTGQIISKFSLNPSGLQYTGALQIRERDLVTTSQSSWDYAPAISFHWGGRHAKRLGMQSDGNLAWNDSIILRADNFNSYALPISGGTMTGAINSTYSSGSYIGGVSNACLNGTYTGYGAILSMPIASGRVSLSTYPGGSSNLVYLGYASSSQISNGTNSFNKALTWDAVNNNLTADTFTGALAGNAATASKWKSPITLTISGSVTGSASVDGSGNVTISTSTNHSHSGYLTSHQTLYSLYLRSGSFSDVTYTPNYCNEWVYIPTTTDHLTEGTTNLFYTDARVQNIVSDKYLPLAGGTMNKDATIGSNTSLYVGSNNNWLYVSNIGSRNGTAYWEISQAGVAKFKGTVTASEFLGNASSASTVTVNNSDSNSTYRMVWHSGSTLYETSGIYCNPSSKVLHAGGFYHTGYGASGYALTADGGATFIRDMSVNYANSAGTATTASKLDTNAGSSTNPVYFSDGIPVACTGYEFIASGSTYSGSFSITYYVYRWMNIVFVTGTTSYGNPTSRGNHTVFVCNVPREKEDAGTTIPGDTGYVTIYVESGKL